MNERSTETADECMWCRYGDHPAGHDCPLHGANSACEPMIFVRADGFYPVASVSGRSLLDQAADHGALNPGTLRVEDMHGNVLWRLQ